MRILSNYRTFIPLVLLGLCALYIVLLFQFNSSSSSNTTTTNNNDNNNDQYRRQQQQQQEIPPSSTSGCDKDTSVKVDGSLDDMREQVQQLQQRIAQMEQEERRKMVRPVGRDLTIIALGRHVLEDAMGTLQEKDHGGRDAVDKSTTEQQERRLLQQYFSPYYKPTAAPPGAGKSAAASDPQPSSLHIRVLPQFDYTPDALRELNQVLREQVDTTHVLIMDPHTRLPRNVEPRWANLGMLVDSLNNDGVDMVGTVTVDSESQVIRTPCFRFYHHMWQLSHERYQLGYDVHQGRSMYCERTSDTFAARTAVLVDQLDGFDPEMREMAFVDLQLRAAKTLSSTYDDNCGKSGGAGVGVGGPCKIDDYSASIVTGMNPFVLMERDGEQDSHISGLTKQFSDKHQVELFIDTSLKRHEECISRALVVSPGTMITYCRYKNITRTMHFIHDFWTRNGTELDTFGLSLSACSGTMIGAARSGSFNLFDIDIDLNVFGPDETRTNQRLEELSKALKRHYNILVIHYKNRPSKRSISGHIAGLDLYVVPRPPSPTAFVEFDGRKFLVERTPLFSQFEPKCGNVLEHKMHYRHRDKGGLSQCSGSPGHNACSPNCVHNGSTGLHPKYCSFDYTLPEYRQPHHNQLLAGKLLTRENVPWQRTK